MNRILIIGATGFIGSKVADFLKKLETYEIICYSRTPRQGFFPVI